MKIWWVVPAILLAVFAPILVLPYLWSDDYWMVAEVADGHSLIGWISHVGRPLYGVTLQAALSVVGEEMRVLRLVGVIGLMAISYVVAQLCVPVVDRRAAVAVGALSVLMATFQVYASFSICFAFPFATALSAAAMWMIAKNRWPLALGLQCAAMLIYQPAATAIAGTAVVLLVFDDAETKIWRRRAIMFLGVYGLSCCVAWVAIQIGGKVFGDGSTYDRAAVSHDVGGKLHWFTTEVLVNAFTPVSVRASVTVAIFVGVLWLAALWLAAPRDRWCRLAVGVALLPLSYLPNLLASDFYASYRTQAGLEMLVAIGLSLGAARAWQRHLGPRSSFVLPLLAVLVAGPIATSQTLRYVALPARAEAQRITGVLAGLRDDERVCLIPPDAMDSASPVVRYDEFGRPSTYAYWSQGHAVEVLTGVAVARVDVGACSPPAANARVLDMRGLHLLPR